MWTMKTPRATASTPFASARFDLGRTVPARPRRRATRGLVHPVRPTARFRTWTRGPSAYRSSSEMIESSPSARGGRLGASTTDPEGSTGNRVGVPGSPASRAATARARPSRRASLLAARDARMRVAMVAVVSVAVYTCDEIPDVNQGPVVPIAVSHARSAMPANRIPKNTVRTKGHRRAPTVSRDGPVSRGRTSRRSSSPDHAIESPQDHAQGHPCDGPWDRVEEGWSLVRWNGHRVYGSIG